MEAIDSPSKEMLRLPLDETFKSDIPDKYCPVTPLGPWSRASDAGYSPPLIRLTYLPAPTAATCAVLAGRLVNITIDATVRCLEGSRSSGAKGRIAFAGTSDSLGLEHYFIAE